MNIYILQAVNYTLSFLMWMVLGRIVLALILGGKENFMTGIFAKITDPLYRLVLKIMPFVKERAVPWVTILLIIILRLLLVIIFEPGTARQGVG
jgi:uncharacterized membrane protein